MFEYKKATGSKWKFFIENIQVQFIKIERTKLSVNCNPMEYTQKTYNRALDELEHIYRSQATDVQDKQDQAYNYKLAEREMALCCSQARRHASKAFT